MRNPFNRSRPVPANRARHSVPPVVVDVTKPREGDVLGDVVASEMRRRAALKDACFRSATAAGFGVLEVVDVAGWSVEACAKVPAGEIYTLPSFDAAARFRRAGWSGLS